MTEIHDRTNFDKIAADAIILGFTGAIGSGCTYFAKCLEKFHGYIYISLSSEIHKLAQKNSQGESLDDLQNIGNDLRKKYGSHHLAYLALEQLNNRLEADGHLDKFKLVIDGIRNDGEVAFLRQFPNFCLVSVQAEYDIRMRIIIEENKCHSTDEFNIADKRDEEEKSAFGQQIKKCNYLSDIVISNNAPQNKVDETSYRKYVDEKIYNEFVQYMELSAEEKTHKIITRPPTNDETLMTIAYVKSKRSECLKRKVGAVITSQEGNILSAGYNNVPPGEVTCLNHPSYLWCARDVLLEKLGRNYQYCPKCGSKITIKTECFYCNQKLSQYTRHCTKCNNDPNFEYYCNNCNINIFKDYLPGGKPETGKMMDMCRSLHAEESAILNLARVGISSSEAHTIYTTTFPCNLCANKILMVGIKQVVYAEPYVTKEALDILKKRDIKVRPFEGVKSGFYFKFFS